MLANVESSVFITQVLELFCCLSANIAFVFTETGDVRPVLGVDSKKLSNPLVRVDHEDRSFRGVHGSVSYHFWWTPGEDKPFRIEYYGPIHASEKLSPCGMEHLEFLGEELSCLLGLVEAE